MIKKPYHKTVKVADNGAIRIWTFKDQNAYEIKREAFPKGNYIEPGEKLKPADLGFTDSKRTMTFYVEGIRLSQTLGDQTIEANLCQYGEDIVNLTVYNIDADVDSDNDNGNSIPDHTLHEDQFENFPKEHGKITFENILDATGHGKAGKEVHSAGKNAKFTPFLVRIPEFIEVSADSKSKIFFEYKDDEQSSSSSSDFTSKIVLWKKDGPQKRVKKERHQKGGDLIYFDKGYLLNELFISNTCVLFIEGLEESDIGEIKIKTDLWLDGNIKTSAEDHLQLSVGKLDIVYHDMTGIKGIGKTSFQDVERIQSSIQTDGIVTDWQKDVNDGALILMRGIASPFLFDLWQQKKLVVETGYYLDEGAMKPIPVGELKREGELVKPSELYKDPSDIENRLKQIGLNSEIGTEFKYKSNADQKYKVIFSWVYKPPLEFDLNSPMNPIKQRQLDLVLKAKGIIETHGGKPRGLTIVRPPLVLVHGINSHPDMWFKDKPGSFVNAFDANKLNFGFNCKNFRVNHNIPDPEWSSEGPTHACGEITHMYKEIQKMITKAKSDYRENKQYFEYFWDEAEQKSRKPRIAIQKVDIVAHSYGGVLSRWYIEQAAENGGSSGDVFNNRKDVRKLVTLGSPHRGSPLANMVCEVFKNNYIANAYPDLDFKGWYTNFVISEFSILNLLNWFSQQITLGSLLAIIDHSEYTSGFSDHMATSKLSGKLATALDVNRNYPRHAYEVFSINSARLAQLNGNKPLHDDVGYGAIVGTHGIVKAQELGDMTEGLFTIISLFKILQPHVLNAKGDRVNVFPYIWELDMGLSDAIVPMWSAKLGVNNYNKMIKTTHVQMGDNFEINQTVQAWLNGWNPITKQVEPLPRGAAHRPNFAAGAPTFIGKHYVGSTIQSDGRSKGGGLNPTSIIKVK